MGKTGIVMLIEINQTPNDKYCMFSHMLENTKESQKVDEMAGGWWEWKLAKYVIYTYRYANETHYSVQLMPQI